jgi:hypothetical protein
MFIKNINDHTGLDIKEIDVIGDFKVQNILHIQAIRGAVPEALSLKYMADLMLKDHPGKRHSAKDVLTDYPFFSDRKNLLSEEEFSNHAHRICRFGIVTEREESQLINEEGHPAHAGSLASLRQTAMREMILNRGQNLVGYKGGSLSKNEINKVKIAETPSQVKGLVLRIERSAENFFAPPMSDADMKMAYKKR